jgi:uncharacterized membrane protein YvbJ
MGFYCDNCGKKVNRNSNTCPECGVKFKAVKCPSCGYTDQADFFKGGCPQCGFLGEEESTGIDHKGKHEKTRKPFLDFISSKVFWIMSLVLSLILFYIFYLISQDI